MELAAEIIDLHKYYYLGDVVVKALRGVSLEIPKGDFVAIMGSSGSGKSTLLNLLGALDRPTQGQYILGGHDVSKLSDDQLSAIRNQMIGFIFQSYNLIAQYTVLENIEVPLHYRVNAMSAADRQRCRELAAEVGLADRLDHRPFQLSGGQQQRVAIARALVNDPEIILADEPTGNLDSTTEAEIMEMLKKLNQEGRTIIMVTHENEVARLARRQIFMKDGTVAGVGFFPGPGEGLQITSEPSAESAAATGAESSDSDSGQQQPESNAGE
ncbi:MAG: ABC transporter ATP-binding protein [Planctomycetaceae bacterium]